jgi:hypothetical protein
MSALTPSFHDSGNNTRLGDPDDPLWRAIADFQIDEPDAELPFTRRLARDHFWTDDYAARVVAEYRRFLYLMATSVKPLTPSPDVDEAWHLHLAYTRSYWDRLCAKVIGRPLHHDPTEGGEDQRTHFTECYERTLQSYRDVFGPVAPREIWPDVGDRFDREESYRTVLLRDFWVHRRLWSPATGLLISRGLIATGVVAAGALGLVAFPDNGLAAPAMAAAGGVSVSYIIASLFKGPNSVLVYTLVEGDSGGGGDGGGCGGCGGCGG